MKNKVINIKSVKFYKTLFQFLLPLLLTSCSSQTFNSDNNFQSEVSTPPTGIDEVSKLVQNPGNKVLSDKLNREGQNWPYQQVLSKLLSREIYFPVPVNSKVRVESSGGQEYYHLIFDDNSKLVCGLKKGVNLSPFISYKGGKNFLVKQLKEKTRPSLKYKGTSQKTFFNSPTKGLSPYNNIYDYEEEFVVYSRSRLQHFNQVKVYKLDLSEDSPGGVSSIACAHSGLGYRRTVKQLMLHLEQVVMAPYNKDMKRF